MPESLLTCPFDPCHQIRPSKMHYHLIKCKTQHAHRNFLTCPYNATHLFEAKDEANHLTSCPDRIVTKYEPAPGQHGMICNPVVYGSSSIPRRGENRAQKVRTFSIVDRSAQLPPDTVSESRFGMTFSARTDSHLDADDNLSMVSNQISNTDLPVVQPVRGVQSRYPRTSSIKPGENHLPAPSTLNVSTVHDETFDTIVSLSRERPRVGHHLDEDKFKNFKI